ncbi:uncharacterized protein MELLADRAFT_106895 [Melampsora larici-populina 98AG31]|uniref:Uncharacterized protein n=1 Tax=Melampsora larici-populina (strain 98AG31 / pathotype 3-4-7) TaxID=747676 RepID=F4RMZ9_MELLP|nr:uncharacterized protein MELLADRAFT_106895 [Melampsora larici-populina 98AG31]EGG06210.1 hypothetical protein MELLADRAFT_106895 [Melampsora larici-populina 98AG31]
MVISILPYHYNAEKDSEAADIHTAIKLATQIVNVVTLRTINEEDIKMLRNLLRQYREHLQKAWPNIRSKPNLHYAQHLRIKSGVLARRHTLLRTVTGTMLKAHTQKSLFKHIQKNMNPTCRNHLGLEDLTASTTSKWRSFTPPDQNLPIIVNFLQELGHDPRAPLPALESTSYWKHANKIFSPFSTHKGNSSIQLHNQPKSQHFEYGLIQHIVRLSKDLTQFFIVDCFPSLNGTDCLLNPYQTLPHLKADVVYRSPLIRKCFSVDNIFGHCVVVENPCDTFGISLDTNIVVGLRSMAIIDMSSSYEECGV